MRLFLMAIVLAVAAPAMAQDVRPTISVIGEGRVEAAPDMATISLGARHEAGTAAAALRASSEAVTAVLARLTGAGIEERDVQTSGLDISPRWSQRYDNRPPGITGFVASNTVTVRVRDLDGLGALLDVLVGEDGANNLGGIGFGLQEPRAAQDAARRAAVADARARAELYAEEAGVSVGPVISIGETVPPAPVMRGVMMEAAMASDMPVPVARGELEITAQVRMVFAIEGDE